MTLIEALALKLHDTYGCRITCRGGRLADDRHPSHMEAYREPAEDILRDPAFREALTEALAEARAAALAEVYGYAEHYLAREKERIRAAVADLPHNMWTAAQGRERVLRIIEGETP